MKIDIDRDTFKRALCDGFGCPNIHFDVKKVMYQLSKKMINDPFIHTQVIDDNGSVDPNKLRSFLGTKRGLNFIRKYAREVVENVRVQVDSKKDS